MCDIKNLRERERRKGRSR